MLGLARHSVTDPRGGARRLMDLHLTMPVRWSAFLLIVVLSAVVAHVSVRLLTEAERASVPGLLPGPFGIAVIQAAMLFIAAVLVFQLGRSQGGKGSFADALILIVWLQAVLLGLQVLQVAAHLLAPVVGGDMAQILGDIIGVLGLGLTFWLLTGFIAELHQFRSLGRVFLAVIGVSLAIAVFLSVMLLTLIQAGMLANV